MKNPFSNLIEKFKKKGKSGDTPLPSPEKDKKKDGSQTRTYKSYGKINNNW